MGAGSRGAGLVGGAVAVGGRRARSEEVDGLAWGWWACWWWPVGAPGVSRPEAVDDEEPMAADLRTAASEVRNQEPSEWRRRRRLSVRVEPPSGAPADDHAAS